MVSSPSSEWVRRVKRRLGPVRHTMRFWKSGFGLPWLSPNMARLKGLRDRYAGRRGFVIGNGPSLKIEDVDRLKNEVTFAANKIYLLFDDTAWRPTFWSVVDRLVVENNLAEIDALNLSMFMPYWVAPYLSPRENRLYYQPGYELHDESTPQQDVRFSGDVSRCVYCGYTVTYDLMQLAFFMGIRELYLIGMDHSWVLPKERRPAPEFREVLTNASEVNHFHKDYRKPGESWTLPRVECQEMAFRAARSYFERHRGAIKNATRGGKLEIFERADLDSLLD